MAKYRHAFQWMSTRMASTTCVNERNGRMMNDEKCAQKFFLVQRREQRWSPKTNRNRQLSMSIFQLVYGTFEKFCLPRVCQMKLAISLSEHREKNKLLCNLISFAEMHLLNGLDVPYAAAVEYIYLRPPSFHLPCISGMHSDSRWPFRCARTIPTFLEDVTVD